MTASGLYSHSSPSSVGGTQYIRDKELWDSSKCLTLPLHDILNTHLFYVHACGNISATKHVFGRHFAGGSSLSYHVSRRNQAQVSRFFSMEPLLTEPSCWFVHHQNTYTKSKNHEVLVSVFPLWKYHEKQSRQLHQTILQNVLEVLLLYKISVECLIRWDTKLFKVIKMKLSNT